MLHHRSNSSPYEPIGAVAMAIHDSTKIQNSSLSRQPNPATRLGRYAQKQHGQSQPPTRTYRIWWAMMTRCLNSHARAFPRYGGRGITVCKHWRTFTHFFADMGACPDGLTIERIDNDKGYEPGNCRWATYREQANNSRHNRYLTFHGVTQNIAAWSAATGFKQATISRRLDGLGWTIEEALTLPLHGRASKRDPR